MNFLPKLNIFSHLFWRTMALHLTPEVLLFIAIFADMVFTGLFPFLVLHVAPLLPLHSCAGHCVEGERGSGIGGNVQAGILIRLQTRYQNPPLSRISASHHAVYGQKNVDELHTWLFWPLLEGHVKLLCDGIYWNLAKPHHTGLGYHTGRIYPLPAERQIQAKRVGGAWFHLKYWDNTAHRTCSF